MEIWVVLKHEKFLNYNKWNKNHKYNENIFLFPNWTQNLITHYVNEDGIKEWLFSHIAGGNVHDSVTWIEENLEASIKITNVHIFYLQVYLHPDTTIYTRLFIATSLIIAKLANEMFL